MRKIKNWTDFLKEDANNPTPEELNKFRQDLLSGNTQVQQHHKNYKIEINEVRKMVQSIVYTPEFLAELTRRKVEIPDVAKMKMTVERRQYHRCFEYNLVDGTESFSVLVTIEVPYDKSFEDDNTMITASIYVKNRGRLKSLFGYANKRALKDKEFNSYSVGEVLQKAYQDLNIKN